MASEGRALISRRPVDDEDRVEDLVAQLDDADLGDAVAERLDDVLEQVVGQRPRRLDALLRVGDGGRLGGTDPDGQVALTVPLAQQHDRLVRGHFDPHPEDVDGLHLVHVTSPGSGSSARVQRCRTPVRTRAVCRAMHSAGPRASGPPSALGRAASGTAAADRAGRTICSHQADLAVRRGAERAQVPGFDAVCGQGGGRPGDGERVVVEVAAGVGPDQAVVLQGLEGGPVEAGRVSQLPRRHAAGSAGPPARPRWAASGSAAAVAGRAARASAPPRLPGRQPAVHGVEGVADHLQRPEPVTLGA